MGLEKWKTLKKYHYYYYHNMVIFILAVLNIFYILFQCFHYWLWTCKCQLGFINSNSNYSTLRCFAGLVKKVNSKDTRIKSLIWLKLVVTTPKLIHIGVMLISKLRIFLVLHCVKSVRIWSFSGPYFPAYGRNTERYSVALRIQAECGKIWTRKHPNTYTFYAVLIKKYEVSLLVSCILSWLTISLQDPWFSRFSMPQNMLWKPLNPFYANRIFQYPLKTFKNHWTSNVKKEYQGVIEGDQWHEMKWVKDFSETFEKCLEKHWTQRFTWHWVWERHGYNNN